MTTAMEPETETQTLPALRMVRGEISGRELQRWMGARRLQDTDHALHCLLVECFGDLAPKPFRAIMDRQGMKGVLYGYGAAEADQLRESAAICADPLQLCILPPESLQDKAMPSEWSTGKRLGFEVRVRPVVRKARGSDRHRDEQDAFLQAVSRYGEAAMPYTREDIYVRWLAERMAGEGAAIVNERETRLHSFQRLRSYRRRHARYVEGPDAMLRGTLTVGDPAAFSALMSRGVGRHRAYGYGMLLLRPALHRPSGV